MKNPGLFRLGLEPKNVESSFQLLQHGKQSGATTRAEVLRRALAVYVQLLAAEARGSEVWFKDADGTSTKVLFL